MDSLCSIKYPCMVYAYHGCCGGAIIYHSLLSANEISDLGDNSDWRYCCNILLSVNYSATERVAGYLESFELNELSTLNITLRQSIIAFVAFSFISEDKVNHWFSKIYLIGICLHNLFISVPMINRMILANMIFVIIVFSWSFDLIRTNVKMKKVINVIMFVVVLYFTRVYIINQVGYDVQNTQRMHPYYFFFEDYHDHPSIKYF